jgi:excisionase family DNA binding protein
MQPTARPRPGVCIGGANIEMSVQSCGIGNQLGRNLNSPAETEQLLGLSHATIYQLLKARKLTAVKIGAATRITAESIERLLAESAIVGH